LFKSAAVLHK